jgi:hypothetical protein
MLSRNYVFLNFTPYMGAAAYSSEVPFVLI